MIHRKQECNLKKPLESNSKIPNVEVNIINLSFRITHGVQDIIRSVIENIRPVVPVIPPVEDIDAEQELFLSQNKHLRVPLEFKKKSSFLTFYSFSCIILRRYASRSRHWPAVPLKPFASVTIPSGTSV